MKEKIMEWQPIETVPTKGTILTYHPSHGILVTRTYIDGYQVFEDFFSGKKIGDPTHWMLLPKPPVDNNK